MQYVLVHGSWQGAWCWQPLLPFLSKHEVACIDLPGHGNPTYDTYYQYLEKAVLSSSQPVILVAHSMSGILAAPLLDCYPDKIAHLFLIAAYVAQNGQTLLDLALSGGPSVIPSLLLPKSDPLTQQLDPEKAKTTFFHGCPPVIAEWAASQLQPQPLLPLTTPVRWKDSGKTIHKRTYIFCEEDCDVHPITQQKIIGQYPCQVIKMKTGHFPFLSHPQECASIITTFND